MKKSIVFTGGGTAGHVTPNMALIPIMQKLDLDIHYIGTSGIEKSLITDAFDYVSYHEIPAGKLRRYFSLSNFSDPFKVISGINIARDLLKQIRPSVVFSKGGFVSVPVVIAAKNICPVIAHESDYSIGLATKISKKYAQIICASFSDTVSQLGKKGIYTGSPVRETLFFGNREKGLAALGFSNDKPVLLSMGGSLGAAAVNYCLRDSLDTLLRDFNVVNICGKNKKDENISRENYVQFEYLTDKNGLPDIFAAADIVLSRAGANSVFEFLALKKPMLLIPLPSKSSRGDQIQNADYLKKRGLVRVLPQENMTPDTLVDSIKSTFSDSDMLTSAISNDDLLSNGTKAIVDILKKYI